MSARAPSGIRCATKQGAVWGLLHHGTGRCLRLATLRNEVQKHSGKRWRRRALAERWEVRRVTGIGEALGSGHPYTRAKFIRGWQDSCAVHDLRASDGESAPWRQDARAAHSPTALCGAFRTHSTHILPKLAVFEYMQAICCRELAFFSSEAPS